MHVVIINGSPRVQKYSNTEKIIASFTKGLSEKGASFKTYTISNRKSWEMILLQSGFAEGCQLRCGEEFLAKLPQYLGTSYGGCLVKGNNFGIRVLDEEKQDLVTKPYQAMGELFAEGDGFFREEAKKFTGPEYFSLPMRLMMRFVFKTFAKKMFQKAAASWGCNTTLDEKVWETNSSYRE